ncbi:MAG: GTP-binding protein [Rhizonema sp. PD37]|nr:GTP-binding protein [Rhizonema sp. PD37]
MSKVCQKICLVGDFGVGKTSLVRRFVDRQFSDKYLSNVGVKISQKSVELAKSPQETQAVKLIIWDIEGSNKFKTTALNYFKGAKGALIVGDVTRQETLASLSNSMEKFLNINPNSYIVIALNKADLIEDEYLETLRKLYLFSEQTYVLATYLTSARNGNNVDEIFKSLTHKLMQSSNFF